MENTTLKLGQPWAAVREKIKEANVNLSDEDLQYDGKDSEELLSRLSAKMKRTPQEVREWIESVAVNSGKAS